MKWIKPFLLFLLLVVVCGGLLSLLAPTRQKLERSITITAPASLVYEQLASLQNFQDWSVWSRQDSTAVITLGGKDGTVGAVSKWKGDPDLSGEGKIEITGLEPGKKIVHSIHLIAPKKRTARSVFFLNESNGVTTVTWEFEMDTPRPWNMFNLFSSLDKNRGKDFEEGLAAFKKIMDAKTGAAAGKTFEVFSMDFPASTFASIRQQVKWSDMSAFFGQHYPILYSAAAKANVMAGTASGLYYSWDSKNQLTDMAAAIPVPAGTKLENSIISLVDIPASKAIYINYTGAYDRLSDAYSSLRQYLEKNELKQKGPSIEQYIAGPGSEKDTAKWLTKIVFLVE